MSFFPTYLDQETRDAMAECSHCGSRQHEHADIEWCDAYGCVAETGDCATYGGDLEHRLDEHRDTTEACPDGSGETFKEWRRV